MKLSLRTTVGLLLIATATSTHAQLGMLTGGLMQAIPNILGGVTNKVMGKDPNQIQDVDRAAIEARFEQETQGMAPEQKAALRVQMYQAIGASNSVIAVERQQAQMMQDQPLINTQEVLAGFVGGALNYHLLLGQASVASKVTQMTGSTNTGMQVLGMGGSTYPQSAAPGMPIGMPVASPVQNPVIDFASRGVVGLFNKLAAKPFEPALMESPFGTKLNQSNREQIRAAMFEKGVLPQPAGIGLDDLGDRYNSHLPIEARMMNVGYEPGSFDVAMVVYELGKTDMEKQKTMAEKLTELYGKPEIQQQNGVARATWKTEEGQVFLTVEGANMSAGWTHESRFKNMVAAIEKHAGAKRAK